MFWLGSVNRTAGLPFFTQIRFRLKHRRWGKLNRTTRSRRREQPLSLFLSFHALPNLVQKRVQSRAQRQVKLHPSIHLSIPPSIHLSVYPSMFLIRGLFQLFFLRLFVNFFLPVKQSAGTFHNKIKEEEEVVVPAALFHLEKRERKD